MISYIHGGIAYCNENSIIIDVNGLGYQVIVTQPTLHELRDRKDKIQLYTHLHVREDALILYGFKTISELDMFKLLISVTRVGPQLALNILSQIKVDELADAIIHEDERILTRISGVGPKNAKRLILELRDKMDKKAEGFISADTGSVNYDAVSVLVSLGFAKLEAQKAVEAVSLELKEPTVQALVKAALLKLKAQ